MQQKDLFEAGGLTGSSRAAATSKGALPHTLPSALAGRQGPGGGGGGRERVAAEQEVVVGVPPGPRRWQLEGSRPTLVPSPGRRLFGRRHAESPSEWAAPPDTWVRDCSRLPAAAGSPQCQLVWWPGVDRARAPSRPALFPAARGPPRPG